MRLYYFDIPIDDVSRAEALSKVELYLSDGRQHYITTPNPEMVMLSRKDSEFKTALQGADLSLIDGFGLMLGLWLLSGKKPNRLTGADFLESLLQKFGRQYSFFILGGEKGVAESASSEAKKNYDVNLAGYYEPPRQTYDSTKHIKIINQDTHYKIISRINERRPDVLIVAIGHNQQEKWMAAYLKDCPSVKVAIGVGGAIDYLGKSVKRAPKFMRQLGLEWLWRLILQPTRIKRIITATIFFPMILLKWYISENYKYRQGVVGCLINDRGEILIVSRIDDSNHWQLPQGGVESGESPEDAIFRELKEEIGTNSFEIIGQSKPNVHKYRWKKGVITVNGNSYTQPFRRYGFRGQAQTIFYLRYNGKDSDIKLDQEELLDWKWVNPVELVEKLHPVRRSLAKIIINDLHDFKLI